MLNSFRKALYAFIPLVVYAVAHDIMKILLMYVLQQIAGKNLDAYSYIVAHDAFISACISIIDMLVAAVAVIILMKRDMDEFSLRDYVNLSGLSFYCKDRIHKIHVSWGIVVIQALSLSIGLNILLYITGFTSYSDTYSKTSQSQYSLPIWMGILLYGLLSPAVEELVFRVVIFGRMKRWYPYVVSVIVTSLLFGLYHRNLVQGLYGTIMGVFMCIACEYLHTVVASFVFHAVANLTVYILSSISAYNPLFGWRVFTGEDGSIRGMFWCIVMLVIAVATVICQYVFSKKSREKYGLVEGIAPVGVFYIDETLFMD